MMPLIVGQELWRVAQYRNSDCRTVKVTKIGRKWATLDNGERVNKQTLYIDGGNGAVWPSKEAHARHVELQAAWSRFQKLAANSYRVPTDVCINQIENAARSLFKRSVTAIDGGTES
jgi:hypothetical protein